jgi:hypothetical protein
MTIASSRRTRVILAFVVPCAVFVVMIAVYGDTTAVLIVSPFTGLVWLVPEYLGCGLKKPFRALASVIAPPALTILLIVVDEEILRPSGIDVGTVFPGPWISLIALGVGLALLARVFRLYAIPLSLVYLPLMWLTLIVVGYPLALSYQGG